MFGSNSSIYLEMKRAVQVQILAVSLGLGIGLGFILTYFAGLATGIAAASFLEAAQIGTRYPYVESGHGMLDHSGSCLERVMKQALLGSDCGRR